jgi:hypothetical protein
MEGTSIDALKQQQRKGQVNMKILAKDIENSLINRKIVAPTQRVARQNKKYENFQDNLNDTTDTEDTEDKNEQYKENNNQNKRKKSFNFKNFIREPLLLLVIYLIFSVDGVQEMIAKKIPQILPSQSTGQVSYLGKLIYGLIIVITFTGARYVVNLRD